MRSGLARVLARAALAFVAATAGVGALVSEPADARADDAAAPSVALEGSGVRGVRAVLEGAFAEMRVTSLRVRDQLRLTRKRGTRRQVMCVDEALSRADVGLRHARALGDEMLAAHARGDVDSVRLALGQLEELRSLTRFASEQATKCAPGGITGTSGVAAAVATSAPSVTTVRMDVDPRIPRVD